MVQTPTRQLTLAEFLALPVPAVAKSIQHTVEQLFSWIKKQPQAE
jgi:hypothetical protein